MRLFTDILREIRKGRAVDQASLALAEVVRAVDQTGKPGSISVKLTVRPEKGGGTQKTLICSVSANKPEGDIPEAVFFSDHEGDLHRVDPAQNEMFTDTDKARTAAKGGTQ